MPRHGGKNDRSLLGYLLDSRDLREQRMKDHGTFMPAWPQDRLRATPAVVA